MFFWPPTALLIGLFYVFGMIFALLGLFTVQVDRLKTIRQFLTAYSLYLLQPSLLQHYKNKWYSSLPWLNLKISWLSKIQNLPSN